MSYTIWKRGRQIKIIENRIKTYINEQEKIRKGKNEKAKKEGGNDKGSTSGRS
jgi:hypothetical protein